KNWYLLLVIGLLMVSLGNLLNHFGVIGDAVTGVLIGMGVGVEILAVFESGIRKGNGLGLK
ncbi:MAG: hypothetical protein KDB79_13815, partial [Acidobacteria bacterium]|nr:hypothetical protein [Acidobacteriota bacterium]